MKTLKRRGFAHRREAGSFSSLLQFLFGVCTALVFAVNISAQSRDDVLKEYLGALEGYDIPTKIEECDFILSSCDPASRPGTALRVFNHFRDSKFMGDENVAVHVADKWILGKEEQKTKEGGSDKTAMLPDSTLTSVRSYAEFNRASLLGMKAPLLPEAGLEGFSDAKNTVLWFYDTDCAKCKLEAIKLEDFFSRHSDCEFIAFYIGDDLYKWKEFQKTHFCGIPDVRHLCDPSDASNFRKKYSVTATPRMFLIDTEGIIIGRMLDTESLKVLLAERAKREKTAITELFYQLVPLRGEDAKDALEYLIDSRILCDGSLFNTAEDSLMVVNFAQIQKELLSKARPGTKIAPIRVRGSLNGGKTKEYRLDRLSRARGRHSSGSAHATRKEASEANGKTVVVFHTNGCHQCEAELKAAESLNINVFEVNADDIQAKFPKTFARLLDSFDLSTLPLLIETDRHDIITRRYFSLTGNK